MRQYLHIGTHSQIPHEVIGSIRSVLQDDFVTEVHLQITEQTGHC
jgi:hypothetical protein